MKTSRERAERTIFVSGFPQTDGETLRRCIVAAIDAAVDEAVASERDACAMVVEKRREFYRECGNASRVDEDTRVSDAIRARGAK